MESSGRQERRALQTVKEPFVPLIGSHPTAIAGPFLAKTVCLRQDAGSRVQVVIGSVHNGDVGQMNWPGRLSSTSNAGVPFRECFFQASGSMGL
jgi:hypothetical protein